MPSYFVPSEGDEEPRCFEIETVSDGCYRVTTPEGEEFLVDAYEPEPGRLHMLMDNKSFDVDVRESDREFTVQLRGEKHHVTALNERQRRMKIAGVGARGGGGPNLESPMAGKVVAVHVAEGDDVETGDKVVIVEAMKMENDLKAHKAGTIAEICVAPGDAVEIGDVLLEIAE
jgi:biotin carboxyl carrier protein